MRNTLLILFTLAAFFLVSQNKQSSAKGKEFYLIETSTFDQMTPQEKAGLDSLLTVYHSQKKVTKKIETLLSIPSSVTDLRTLSLYNDLAKATITKALSLEKLNKEETSNLRNSLARTYCSEGVLYLYEGKNEKSLTSFSLALTIAKKEQNLAVEAEVYNSLGGLYQYKGELKEAAKYFQMSLELFAKIGDKPSQALLYYNLGQVYLALLNYPEAIMCAKKSAVISEKTGNKIDLQSAYALIGTILYQQEDHAKSFEYYQKALRVSESIGSNAMASEGLLNMSKALKQQGKDSLALVYAIKANNYGAKAENVLLMQMNLQNLSEILFSQNKLNEALKTGNEGLKLAQENNNQVLEVSLLNTVAKVEMKLGNSNKALLHVEKAFSLSKKLNLQSGIVESASILQEIYSTKGQWKKAYNMIHEMVDGQSTVMNDKNKKEIYKKVYEFEYEKKELKLREEQKLKDAIAGQQKMMADLKLRQSNYFILSLCLLVILIIVVFLLTLRQNKLVSSQRAIQLEQKFLRSQMNPHFIYNCLQGITNFTEELKVKKYLSSFGLLARSVLENSRMELVVLKKELHLLENYFQLQKMLYGSRFDYKINVGPDVEEDMIMIPPMLAQPFIENAIEHGFKTFNSGGFIEVNFHLENDVLYLVIKDNGTGMKSESKSNHQSLATAITKERIELFNLKRKRKATVTITEAFPDQTNKGVMVSFAIPV